MSTDLRERFAELAALPDDEIHLDEAALLIAAEAEVLVVEQYLDELDSFATNFRQERLGYGVPVTSLVNYIHNDLGFSGNVSDYYEPSNSYLNRVIDSRHGIPISLALIHISIGERLDIPVKGISFPGHFLVRYGDGPDAIVDPFSGRKLSHADCQNLLRQIAGPGATLKDEYFSAAGPRDILTRMLDNLKQIFWRTRNWDESKACIDRQLLLLPDREEFNVQLGAVYEMQGNRQMAHYAYTRVLQVATDEKLRELASKRLLALEDGPRTVH